MPHIERTATLAWDGNLARGIGSIRAGSGAFTELVNSAGVGVTANGVANGMAMQQAG